MKYKYRQKGKMTVYTMRKLRNYMKIVGMSIDEVVKKIGKPQRDIGCGARLFQFDLENGEKRTIRFDLDVEKEDEFVYKNPNVTLYGSHFLYVGMICEDLDK